MFYNFHNYLNWFLDNYKFIKIKNEKLDSSKKKDSSNVLDKSLNIILISTSKAYSLHDRNREKGTNFPHQDYLQNSQKLSQNFTQKKKL